MLAITLLVLTDEVIMYMICYLLSVCTSIIRQMHSAQSRHKEITRGQVFWGSLHSGSMALFVILSANYRMTIPPIGNFGAAVGIGIGGTVSFNKMFKIAVDFTRYMARDANGKRE